MVTDVQAECHCCPYSRYIYCWGLGATLFAVIYKASIFPSVVTKKKPYKLAFFNEGKLFDIADISVYFYHIYSDTLFFKFFSMKIKAWKTRKRLLWKPKELKKPHKLVWLVLIKIILIYVNESIRWLYLEVLQG